MLAVEKLDFRGSGFSRRMNRLMTNCGRGTVAKKLADLNARYGIEIHEVESGAHLYDKDLFRMRLCRCEKP
nr:hypothetical protein [Roseovarius gahaiensis]